ncbi:hypothetical protein SK128_015765 [Halocaridina rubra]|uniref:Uncharacterized protein n=1 Tax=Halocaridina rubra TaxID=373956 RepID=A0AAN8XJR5_HALRR
MKRCKAYRLCGENSEWNLQIYYYWFKNSLAVKYQKKVRRARNGDRNTRGVNVNGSSMTRTTHPNTVYIITSNVPCNRELLDQICQFSVDMLKKLENLPKCAPIKH